MNERSNDENSLPCQTWARRCLLRRGEELVSELRTHYRLTARSSDGARDRAGLADETAGRLTRALTNIRTALFAWPADCETCRDPVQLCRPGNLERCQVLRVLLTDMS